MYQSNWLDPWLYPSVYDWAMTLLTLLLAFRYINASDRAIFHCRTSSVRSMWLLAGAVILFLGLRPNHMVFGDMVIYRRGYIIRCCEAMPFDILNSKEPGWDFLQDLVRFLFSTQNVETQFLILCFIVTMGYFGFMAWACMRLDRYHSYAMLLFLLTNFTCYGYCVNGMRNGLGLSMVMLALTFMKPGARNILFAAFLCFAAFSIHHSCAIPAVCLFAASFLAKSPKVCLGFWLLSILVSLTVGPQVEHFLTSFSFDDRLDTYLHIQDNVATMQQYFSKTGFRWDFLAYSIVPIVIGWIALINGRMRDRWYQLLFNTYVLSNAFWIMVIRAGYSNRFAQLSWFLYGLVLAYPLFNIKIFERQGAVIACVILYQLSFLYLF